MKVSQAIEKATKAYLQAVATARTASDAYVKAPVGSGEKELAAVFRAEKAVKTKLAKLEKLVMEAMES